MSAYQSPIPPMSAPGGTPRGGYDAAGRPQDVVTGRVTTHQGTAVPPPHATGTGPATLPRRKSVVLAVVLAGLFGPLGMLYSSWVGAAVTAALLFVLTLVTAPLALLFHIGVTAMAFAMVAPICMIWAALATMGHNGAVGLAHRLVRPTL